MLRPIIEFCSPVYHPLLSKEQSDNLERLQKLALKIIIGFNYTYVELLEIAEIKSLEERRKEAFQKFAVTLTKNERYRSWFPRIEEGTRNTRNIKIYTEEFARTARLYNSPLFSMRRVQNKMIQEERR